ncbi:MAG: N-formylglutamate amidohydrolase [Polyangiaceae bacterium]
MSPTLLLTCEHASRAVPRRYRALFADHEPLLASHRGWDPGALRLAQRLARLLDAELFAGEATRLLVDLNRSRHHPRLLSEITRPLPRAERDRLLADHYDPFRNRFAARLDEAIARGPALHLSVHSFTPVLDGRARNVDLGLLYDPARPTELALCRAWARALAESLPLRVRRNAPYRGAADGHVTALRRRHPGAMYRGVEIEVSQALFPTDAEAIADALASTLRRTLDATEP